MVLGYIFPSEYENYLLSKTDYLYITNNFNFNGKIVKLVLNFLHTVSFQGSILNDLELLFRIRKGVKKIVFHNFFMIIEYIYHLNLNNF